MYASLTLFTARHIATPSFLALALIALAVLLVSCGEDIPDESVKNPIVTEELPAPTATFAPTATQFPTATIAPTATETPYWAKKITPGIAMEQYPPVNDRTDYELRNTQEWLNGDPTTIAALRESGKVVLIDFWTYT